MTGTQCSILTCIAELGEPFKMLIRCTKSQAVHSGPICFCVCSERRSIGLVYSSNHHIAISKCWEQTMLASTSRTVLHQTLIAIMGQRATKCANRGGEAEDDEVFNDVDFPINPGTGAAAYPELADVCRVRKIRWNWGHKFQDRSSILADTYTGSGNHEAVQWCAL